MCWVYEDPAEQLRVTVAFVKAGLARGQRCVHVAGDRSLDEVRRALAAAGVDVAREEERGALRLWSKWDAYLRSGEFDPQAMLEFLRGQQSEALADGFAGLWSSGEMTWALGKETGCDRLIEYEALIDQMADLQRSVILCQYNELLFGRTCVPDVLRTHSGGMLRADAAEAARAAEVGGERYELYRFLMENTHDIVSLYEVDGGRVYVSPSARRLMGWVPAGAFDGVHPDDRSALQQVWRRLLAGENVVVNYRFAHADGSWRWLEARGSFVQFRGRPHVLTVCRDVTERQRAEEEVRSQREILHKIFENVPIGINFFDEHGRIALANLEWERIFGWTLRELEEQQRDIFVEAHPDPEDRRRAREFIAAASGEWSDVKIRSRDGRMIDISVTVVRLSGGTRIGLAQDITDRQRAAEALRDSADRLHDLSRRLLEVQEQERIHLARELHDEFGQLLTGLRLLLKTTRDVPVDAVVTRLEQARCIADQLLERVRGLSFDLRPAALDQLGLLPALLTLVERYTGLTGVQVDFKHQGVDGRLPPEVETAAYRVVQEALTNAARHAGVPGVAVRVWALADVLHLQIEDQGRGFDVQAALGSPRSCGLAGMQERVLLLGGKLTIESRPGAGTQVTAELPLRRSDGRPGPAVVA